MSPRDSENLLPSEKLIDWNGDLDEIVVPVKSGNGRIVFVVFERVLALASLIATLPVFVGIIILIRLESRGPAIFFQPRMGRDGKPFMIAKFRSMYADSDQRLQQHLDSDPNALEVWNAFHKLPDDPRITQVGSVLRRLSLDELPQLLNIVKGDMSFVGPRPYLPSERGKMGVSGLVVLSVLPGLTGLWQISGRNQVTFNDRVKLDVEYVRRRSLWTDISILAKTTFVVLWGKGAM